MQNNINITNINHVSGLYGAGNAYFLSTLLKDIKKATIICKDKNEAEKLYVDLKFSNKCNEFC